MSSIYTLTEWTNNASTLVLSSVPGLNFTDAENLVTSYLTSVGGWIPDNPANPTDLGVAANGQLFSDAAISVKQQQFAQMNTLTVSVPVTLKLTEVGLFAPGTPMSAITTTLQTGLQARIVDALASKAISIVSVDFSEVDDTSVLRQRGILTPSDLVAIQSDIATNPVLVDPASVASVLARSIFGLDATWVCYQMYDVLDSTIECFIGKYIDLTYQTSANTGFEYVVGLDTIGLNLQSCVKRNTQ